MPDEHSSVTLIGKPVFSPIDLVCAVGSAEIRCEVFDEPGELQQGLAFELGHSLSA